MKTMNARQQAIQAIASTQPVKSETDYVKSPAAELYGKHVFSLAVAKKVLSKDAFDRSASPRSRSRSRTAPRTIRTGSCP